MPWWSWLWIAVMLVVTLVGVILDVRAREQVRFTLLGLGSGLACVVFVLNFFGLLRLARWVPLASLPPLAALTLAVLVYEAWKDVKDDPELTVAQKALTIAIAVAIFAPAAVLGFLSAKAV